MRDRLSTRIALAFALVGVAVLLATGAGLFVVLRGLHQEATQASLGDIAQPLVARLPRGTTLAEVRRATTAIRAELPASIGLYVLLPGGRVLGADEPALDLTGLALDEALARAETASGTLADAAGRRHVYTATVLRAAGAATGPTAVVLTTVDRSGAQALGDLVRVIPFAVLMVLVICAPIAWLLVRSVTRPLRRLVAATADLPAGAAAEPLPLSGPEEIRELTGRFNAMRAALDARRAEEAELLASIRHDLRTPVTVIGGFAEALRDGTASGAAAERAAGAIAAEAARLERLIDGLSTIDELGAGRASLRLETLDPAALVRETVARFAPTAAAGGVRIEAEPATATSPLVADRHAVERILGNLVANAVAAVVRPGGRVVVGAVPARLADGRPAVALRVSDDGPGFPPGNLERVFDRLYRGDPSRAGSGSGLGLAIVRALAQAHGGEAIAENLAPSGARVTVSLPGP